MDKNDYSRAINNLEADAEMCENNAPIHEAAGNHAQAELSRTNAAAYRTAAERLQSCSTR